MLDLEKYMARFVSETGENLERLRGALQTIEAGTPTGENLETAYRTSHSVKGAANIFGFERIGHLAEALETVWYHAWRGRFVVTTDAVAESKRAQLLLGQLLESEKAKKQLDVGLEADCLTALKSMSASVVPQN
jgi:two-component system, chemotaxis family, sensor kinase CheA